MKIEYRSALGFYYSLEIEGTWIEGDERTRDYPGYQRRFEVQKIWRMGREVTRLVGMKGKSKIAEQIEEDSN